MDSYSVSKRVLVADDEEDICLYLTRYLERKKMKVLSAFDGAQAKKLIEGGSFDYFLLDCSMPDLTGLELIQEARGRNPKAKIILMSGFPAVNNDVVRELGGDLFIHKPIQLSEIDNIFTEQAP